MSEQSPDMNVIENRSMTTQLICGALMTGVLIFAVIAFVTAQGKGPPQQVTNVMTMIALGFVALQGLVAPIVVRAVTKSGVEAIARGTRSSAMVLTGQSLTDEGRLAELYQTKSIIFWALLEGGAFFGCIAYMIEQEAFAYAPVAVCLVLMAATFPTLSRLRGWIDLHMARVQDVRHEEGIETPK